ncbi:hypothetical protein NLX69_17495 [Rossellomorea sp. BNER]|nr:hypothetical protein [Rossellomorea sp. BNER]
MVNLKEYLVVVNNRLIPLTGALTEEHNSIIQVISNSSLQQKGALN